MSNDMSADEEFAEFMRSREEAARTFLNGDVRATDALTTRMDPASFFGPRGGHVRGAAPVLALYRAAADHLEPGHGKTSFEQLHAGVDGDLAYWVGIYRGSLRPKGQPTDLDDDLRVTEIFRREHGAWKLIHRHADPLVDASSP